VGISSTGVQPQAEAAVVQALLHQLGAQEPCMEAARRRLTMLERSASHRTFHDFRVERVEL